MTEFIATPEMLAAHNSTMERFRLPLSAAAAPAKVATVGRVQAKSYINNEIKLLVTPVTTTAQPVILQSTPISLDINSDLKIVQSNCDHLHSLFLNKGLTDEWIILNCDTVEKMENIFLEFSEEQSDLIFKSPDPLLLTDKLKAVIIVALRTRYEAAQQAVEARKQLQMQKERDIATRKEIVDDVIKHACSGDHDDVANMVLHYIGSDIVCTDIQHKVTWVWDNNTKLWVNGRDEVLINKIMVGVRPIIMIAILRVQQIQQSGTCDNPDALPILEKKLRMLVSKLGTVCFCSKVATLVKARTINPSFISLLDNNNDILPLLNNKVINLRTLQIRDRCKEDYCTFVCPVTYDPTAKSAAIDSFLDDITLRDNTLKLFLQKILGCCLTGYVHLRQMYILHGDGKNGKSTLIGLMTKILGDYYVQAHKEVFFSVGKSGGGPSPYIAELRGKRMAVFSEAEVGDKLNEAQICAFTGDDPIKCKPLYKDPIEFFPHFKCLMLVNNKPDCSNLQALWDRMILIPFNCRYVDRTENLLPHERTINLKFKNDIVNNNEAISAFFNWLVIGAHLLYTEALIIPECVKAATNEYKEERNIYKRFVDDRLMHDETGKLNWKIYGKELYGEFVDWCKEDEGIHPVDKNKFGTEIKKIIGNSIKDRAGWYYRNYTIPSAIKEQQQSRAISTTSQMTSSLKYPLGTIAI